MEQAKTDASTPRYSLWSNIRYVLAFHWEGKRSTLIFCGLSVVVTVLASLLGMLLPKVVVDELMAGASPQRFLAVVGGISLALVAVRFFVGYTDTIYQDSVGTIATYHTPVSRMRKEMTMDYELLESPTVKAMAQKAQRASQSNHTLAHNMPRSLVRLITNGISFLLYGGIIASIHPLLLVLLMVSALINWLFLSAARRYEEAQQEASATLYSRVAYINESMENPAGAKDIRLYGMARWMRALYDHDQAAKEREDGQILSRHMRAGIVDAVLALLRDGAAYAFLITLLLQGRLALGDFVFIFAAIGSLAGWVTGILLQTNELMRGSLELSHIRAYLDYPDRPRPAQPAPLPEGDALPPGLSLQNVSYTYPGAEQAALRDITLDIRPGERIAVVGANGAGKTTLVKLLCGLYHPQAGTVALNGVPTTDYDRDAYFTLFSTVFQDIHLLSTDIAENVSQRPAEETDSARVAACLRMAGLYERVQAMPQREKTLLVRKVNEDAVELSGGELQKLALARALYKDAPVIILDEPTAALDPIAESETYQRFAALTAGKTSVYISHRLASTRFCDRILFIDDHRVAEAGTHDELMRLDGKYAHMFEVQAHYYQKNVEVAIDG